jgi:hypothetical protein
MSISSFIQTGAREVLIDTPAPGEHSPYTAGNVLPGDFWADGDYFAADVGCLDSPDSVPSGGAMFWAGHHYDFVVHPAIPREVAYA